MKKKLLSAGMALILALGLLPAAAFGAGRNVPINAASFPDPIFRERVRTLPGAENGSFTPAELSKITVMEFGTPAYASEGEKIEDLTGIEYFTNLKTLECYGNRLEKLDVSRNTALTRLDCSYNRLPRLDVSRNAGLEILFCDYNDLTQLNVSANTGLTQLYCSGNWLEKLDVSHNKKLATLDCTSNRLAGLDVSRNPELFMLMGDDNLRPAEEGMSLSQLPDFDPARVLEVTGGSLEGGRVHFTDNDLVYTYDCGNEFTARFTLRKPFAPHEMKGYDLVWNESFEGETIPAVWDTEDRDGDGHNWFVYQQEVPTDQIHHGSAALCSRSFDMNEGGNPELTPDNWLYTPAFTAREGSKLTFSLISLNGNSMQEKLGVYVVEENGSPVQLGEDYTTTEKWQDLTVDLSAYAGKKIRVAFVHHNVKNQMALCLDCVCLWEPEDPNSVPKPPVENPFEDVTEANYCHDAVLWALENGVTAGVDDTHFAPAGNCTRAQIVTFLWNAAGQPAPRSQVSPFTDVKKENWYFNAVLWAAEKGITVGVSDREFGADLGCTRAQAMTFLWKYLGRPFAREESSFRDVKPADWFADPVQWAVENHITDGVGCNLFGPDYNCLREQIVTFLYRALDGKLQ